VFALLARALVLFFGILVMVAAISWRRGTEPSAPAPEGVPAVALSVPVEIIQTGEAPAFHCVEVRP
jgi:hypothetical protein